MNPEMQNRDLQSEEIVKKVEAQLLAMGPRYLANKQREFGELDLSVPLDLERVGQLGHRIKGSAKTYGFEGLGKLGDELESACKRGDEEEAKSLVLKIRDFMQKAQPQSS